VSSPRPASTVAPSTGSEMESEPLVPRIQAFALMVWKSQLLLSAKLELLDPPVGGLRVELIGSLDRLAGWVDADHEIAAHPADRQVARIQVREFERIDLGSGRGLTVDSIVPVRRCRGRRVPSFGKASFQILASKSISGVEGSSSAGTALQ
jgi:hypothetical protein